MHPQDNDEDILNLNIRDAELDAFFGPGDSLAS